tara:strand:+ start:5245 stop:6351 length:1107 start_codon:yes stop_codon:yes gene_type:complete
MKRRANLLIKGDYNPCPELPNEINLSSFVSHRHDSKSAKKLISFDKSKIENVSEWQIKAREKLIELMSYDRSLIKVNEKYKKQLPSIKGVKRLRYYLEGFDGNDIPVTLLWSDKVNIHSILICLAGSASGVHLLWGESLMPSDPDRLLMGADVGLQAVENGFLAVCIEQRCFGEREERELKPRSSARCVDSFMHSLLIGRTLIGENVTDVSTVISWLETYSLPAEVTNRKNVWLYGHSTGGTHAVYSAAVDERIKGVIASGCISPITESLLKRRNPEGDAILPGFLKWFEYHDLVCLCAPKPFIAIGGKKDHIFPYPEMLKVIKKASQVYKVFNAENNIHVITGHEGHRMYTEEMWHIVKNYVPKITR